MNGKLGNGVITVGDVAYAVGLFWQTAEDAKSVRKEAQEAAKQELSPPEFFVMREGAVPQWAIGWAAQGHRSKMPAAAACLAEALAGNWIGVFRVDSRWWFVMSRREAIMPDGDVIFDDQDDCRVRFESEILRGGWDRIFAPDGWGSNVDSTALEELLNGNVEPRLSHLQGVMSRLPMSAKIMIAAGVLAVVAAGYVGKTVMDGVAERKRVEEEARQQEMLRRLEQERALAEMERNRLENQKPIDMVDRVWERRPLPELVMKACDDVLRQIMVDVPSWSLTGMSCADAGAAAVWRRDDGGTIAGARYILDRMGGAVDADGNVAQLTKGYASLEPRVSQKAWKIADIQLRVRQMFQEMQLGAGLNVEPRTGMPPDEDPLNPRPRPPSSLVITYSSPLPPTAWAEIWSKFPGFVFEAAAFNIGGTQWSYQGRIYEELTDEELNTPEALDAYRKMKANPPSISNPQQNAAGGVQ